MPKAIQKLHRNHIITIWKGHALPDAKEIKPNTYAQRYSAKLFKQLTDLGYDVQSPVDVYPFPGHYKQPRDCQREMLDFQLRHHRGYNLSEMRTGKSAPVVWNIDIDIRYNNKSKFLVLAPLSTLEDTWRAEFSGIMPHRPVFYSIQGGTKQLKEALKRGKYGIYVINFDKFWRVLPEILAWNPDSVYLDEASDFNYPETRRYEALNAMMKDPERDFLAMSGTPVPNRPTDAWAIARLINPNTPKFFGHFRNKTMIKDPYSQYKWHKKPDADQIVGELMQPSIRFKTDDVNDMPDHEGVVVHTHLAKDQLRMFEDMRKTMVAEDKGKVITAVHAGARIIKLLQIASGAVYDSEGSALVIGAQPKLDEVLRLIREGSGKTLIMSSFTHVQKWLVDKITKAGYKVVHINGGVKAKDRRKIFKEFQEGDAQVMVAHPKPIEYGVKLHAASQVIWFNPVYSSKTFQQGSARIRGPGTGKTVYYMLVSCPLEEEIFNTIKERMESQENAMDIGKKLKQLYTTIYEG